MDPRFKKRLEKSWAGLFYEHVFCQIDEKLFAPLYSSDNGRQNFPINTLVALEIIKHLKNFMVLPQRVLELQSPTHCIC